MMKKWTPLLIVIFIFGGSSEATIAAFPSQAMNFTFLNTDGEQNELMEYQDKPIVLDWAASWCGVCKQNQAIFDTLYDDFKNHSNFLTISYFGSGDDINQVSTLQGSHAWTFGLDINNYASTASAANGDVWIMDKDLNLIYTWDHAVVAKSDFATKLTDVIGVITSEVTSEVVVTSNETFTSSTVITSDDQTITSETIFTSEMTITTDTVITATSNFDPNISDEINTFGLFQNPLFIGFAAVSIVAVGYIQISKRL